MAPSRRCAPYYPHCLLLTTHTTYYSHYLLLTTHITYHSPFTAYYVLPTTYHVLLQALRPSQFVEAIAMAFGLQDTDFQLGQHKIFLRSGTSKYS